MNLSQADIACLLMVGMYSALDAYGLAVVPRDPCAPLALDNAVLVTRARRRKDGESAVAFVSNPSSR